PVMCLALVASAVASRGYSSGIRRASLVVAIVLACASLTLIRTNGVTGDVDSDIAWRWTPTPEQRLLARAGEEPVVPSSAAIATEPAPQSAQLDPMATAPTPTPAVVDAAPVALAESAPEPAPPTLTSLGSNA